MSTHPSGEFARALVAALAQLGVEDYVLSPGSRSGPLAHALAEAAGNPPPGAPRVRLHVRIDERTAGFLALGIARGVASTAPRRPVAVVTTSGTAVGNLLPAVMEAHHSGVPLILLTADRPAELRGVGANQTTRQPGIFGTFVQWAEDLPAPEGGASVGLASEVARRAVTRALGDASRQDISGAPGPVHLNVAFRDPLGPDGGPWPDLPAVHPTPVAMASVAAPLAPLAQGVVIAGDGAGDAARLVAEAHGWPLLAEPTSGARAGGCCIPDYARLLAGPHGETLARQVRQVVVVGRPTLSRSVQALIARAPALAVAGFGARWSDAPAHAESVLPAVPASWLERTPGEAVDRGWLEQWRAAAEPTPAESWGPRAIAAAFAVAVGAGIGVVGSSGPVRALDRVLPAAAPGAAPTLIANRGLAGIDGTVSTAVGVALATRRPVLALMGDVTFLHDAGGLLVGPREERPRLRIVVVNDGGGTIFAGLEHAAASAADVERVFTTPHGAHLAALCEAYRVPHLSVTSQEGLTAALAAPCDGLEVIEAVL